jgi:serine/threonine protein phosphatase PrpC
MKNVGTCALTVVVSNNRVYVANAGDSKGILIFEQGENMGCVKLNRKFNTASKHEQTRLKSQFSD